LGHIIYYGEDEGLRNLVVLKPEWLTKAIGYVLEDTPTREAGGVLDYHRLKEIWEGRDVAYPARYHPYFLRLMEKFDVSYRLDDEAHASLIGQLVPYEKPPLPWDGAVEEDRPTRSLSLVCEMSEAAPGLVAWLTVRNHRFSTERHWRSGVFLGDPRYTSKALFELTDDRHLTLTVRAPSPDYFFSILRDSIEYLIQRRWPGLSYELLVPCPTLGCPGKFKFRALLRWREADRLGIDCHECLEGQEVARLLTGFSIPSMPPGSDLERMEAQLEEVAAGIGRLEGYEAAAAHQLRGILKVLSAEVIDCPRLFTLTPATGGWDKARFWKYRYRLTLWCEHPGHQHPWSKASYEWTRPREWFSQLGPYLRLLTKTLRIVVPVAGAVGGVAWTEKDLKSIEDEIELMKTLVDQLPKQDAQEGTPLESTTGLESVQGAGLRALRALLLEQDPSRAFGGLERVQDRSSGDFLWVCPRHYPEYDPGLVTMPE
ncbi:MAG: COR domain-containing protein, partial [Actinomycetota bacterium]